MSLLIFIVHTLIEADINSTTLGLVSKFNFLIIFILWIHGVFTIHIRTLVQYLSTCMLEGVSKKVRSLANTEVGQK